MRRKSGKPKRVSYKLLTRDHVTTFPLYALLDDLVQAHHPDLRDARIALAWCTSWKPDVDGVVTLGKCKKASDLDRELAAYDFIILLRRAFWLDLRVTDAQRAALLDHELCHAALKLDEKGEPIEDERGRKVYRVRKHSIEEFTEIVERHGCYKSDLEAFFAAMRRSGAPKFEPCEVCRDNHSPGWVLVVDPNGVERLQRCQCWTAWAESKRELASA